MKEILLQHAAKYPNMRPADAVKLIYQNEFGGGHLVRDEAAFFSYLVREYASVEKDPGGLRQEPIGNGICRVYLGALTEPELEELGRAFLRSARAHRGSLDRFLKKLEILREVTAEGAFSFDREALEQYLEEYAAAGYPMVSHSPQYRAAYKPAYRIVLQSEWMK